MIPFAGLNMTAEARYGIILLSAVEVDAVV